MIGPKVSNPQLQLLIDNAFGVLSLYQTPDATLRVLFSGGKDSTVVAHLASYHPAFNGVAHIVTKTGPASIKHSRAVVALAENNHWDCLTKEPATSFEMLVAKFGCPGPAAHSYMYRYLKERPIRQLAIQARSKDRKKRVLWASGIRRAESAARQQGATERTVVSSLEWWINPILDWSDEDVRHYIEAFDLKVPHWNHSIDCFCGAYATPEERALIAIADPDQYQYILLTEQIARAGREIQLLEVKLGVRKEQDVIPEEYCTWGHGLNRERLKEMKTSGPTICNKCGVVDEILRQKQIASDTI